MREVDRGEDGDRPFPPSTRVVDPVLTAQVDAGGIDAATSAMRRAAEALLRAGPTAEGLDDITTQLHAIADRLDASAPTLDERMRDMWAGEGMTRHDAVTGPENVIAPPLSLRGRPDGWVSGSVTLGLLYQGPPGYVHGGVSALLLDHALGVANHWGGHVGMTARLTVTYLRPAPLHQPLEVRGRQTGVTGRKIYSEGELLTADGQPCVRADGLFITFPDPDDG